MKKYSKIIQFITIENTAGGVMMPHRTGEQRVNRLTRVEGEHVVLPVEIRSCRIQTRIRRWQTRHVFCAHLTHREDGPRGPDERRCSHRSCLVNTITWPIGKRSRPIRRCAFGGCYRAVLAHRRRKYHYIYIFTRVQMMTFGSLMDCS